MYIIRHRDGASEILLLQHVLGPKLEHQNPSIFTYISALIADYSINYLIL